MDQILSFLASHQLAVAVAVLEPIRLVERLNLAVQVVVAATKHLELHQAVALLGKVTLVVMDLTVVQLLLVAVAVALMLLVETHPLVLEVWEVLVLLLQYLVLVFHELVAVVVLV
jgi:hypothetical protein